MTVRNGAGPHEAAIVRSWHAGTHNEVQLEQGLDRAKIMAKRQAGFEAGGKYEREVTSTHLIDGMDLDRLARDPGESRKFLAELGDIELAQGALRGLRTRDDYWNDHRFQKLQQGTQEVGFCRESISFGHLIESRRKELAANGDGGERRAERDPFTTTVKIGRLGL